MTHAVLFVPTVSASEKFMLNRLLEGDGNENVIGSYSSKLIQTGTQCRVVEMFQHFSADDEVEGVVPERQSANV